jgi:pimeloyl-ACP methyl ester carboxylesterase
MEIIFIPGLLCTNQIWGKLNAIRNQYKCHDADVLQFDSIEKISDNIITHLPQDDITVIGISMGGYVAIDLALKIKNKINKLILINTTYDSVNLDTIPDRMKCIELAKNGMLDNILRMNAGYCYFKPKSEWIALEKEMAKQVGSDAYIKQQHAIINRQNYSESIKNITCETLIIAGKNDPITPYRDSIYMFEQISSSHLLALNECGHLATLEKGNIVLNAVNLFLGNNLTAPL